MSANGEDANARARKIYHQRRDEGVCVKCGKRYAWGGSSMCKPCMERTKANSDRRDPGGKRHYEWYTNRLEARRANGLCIECGRRLTDGRYSRCKACRRRRAEYQQVRRIRERLHGTS